MDEPHRSLDEKPRKKEKKKKQKQREEEVEVSVKMPSMKTASDVVSRLLWDESLPKRKFVVGYLDRFIGTVETPFVSLDWSDPSSVDNNTLALPKHRIQYFKYRNRKVWDKNTRTDIIFGSTGCSVSIYEFMQLVDNNKLGFMDECIFGPSEDNVSFEDKDDSSSEENERPLPRPDASERPNFFVAARIVDPETVENLSKVSDYIKGKDSSLAGCCLPKAIFHITLAILKLDSASDVNEAVQAMKAMRSAEAPRVSINLETLDVFRHRVLYACLQEADDLNTLREHLVKELTDRNLNVLDRYAFVPHVTVAKISRSASRSRHSNYIDQYLYLQFEDDYFGSQALDTLYLCEMCDQRREDGFYKCAVEVNLK